MSTDQSAATSDDASGNEDARLVDLPVRDMAPAQAAALKVAARQAFVDAHRDANRGPWDGLASLYHRALEPTLVAAGCCAYLGWAIVKVLTLHP